MCLHILAALSHQIPLLHSYLVSTCFPSETSRHFSSSPSTERTRTSWFIIKCSGERAVWNMTLPGKLHSPYSSLFHGSLENRIFQWESFPPNFQDRQCSSPLSQQPWQKVYKQAFRGSLYFLKPSQISERSQDMYLSLIQAMKSPSYSFPPIHYCAYLQCEPRRTGKCNGSHEWKLILEYRIFATPEPHRS